MNSKVIRLADLEQFQVNPEYKQIEVTKEEIEALMESMASNMGQTVSVSKWEENACLVCKTKEDKKLLLYPSLALPGVALTAEDARGKKIGDCFSTCIKGCEVSLTLEAILVNRALFVDDSLAKACEIEGVETLGDLRSYLTKRESDKKKEENIRNLVMGYVQFMMENSEVEIDEAEVNEWIIPEAKRIFDEELSFGIDLRFTEDGQMISEEEALRKLAEELRPQFSVNLIEHKFAEENGFVPSEEETFGNPYDAYMYQILTERAKEALA